MRSVLNKKGIALPSLSKSVIGTIFIIPTLMFVAFSLFIPTIWNLILSFQQWDGFNVREWIYADNYIKAFKDDFFMKSLFNSAFIAVVTTIFAVVMGVMLAGLIYRLGKKEGAIYRLIIFMPSMIPLSIIGLLFTFIYNSEMGILNQFLKLIGLETLKTAWLENQSTVMWCISVVGIWKILGLTMMLCFAAMQMIPVTLLESSKLEGASYRKQFTAIMLPLIRPIIQLSAVFTLMVSFKSYDLVFILTKGGPAGFSYTVPLYMIDTGFGYNEFGYSSAMGVILTVAVMTCVFILNKLLGGEKYEY